MIGPAKQEYLDSGAKTACSQDFTYSKQEINLSSGFAARGHCCNPGIDNPEEACIKVFAQKDNSRIPSVFWIWRSANFQERKYYDMV
jgi:NADH:ubiquinone oxidoreductase subunit C